EARGQDTHLDLPRNVGRAPHEDQIRAPSERDDVEVLEALPLREARRVQVRAVRRPEVLDPVVLPVEGDLGVTPRHALVGDGDVVRAVVPDPDLRLARDREVALLPQAREEGGAGQIGGHGSRFGWYRWQKAQSARLLPGR